MSSQKDRKHAKNAENVEERDRLKTIQAALLLLFADGIHPLFQVCSGNLGIFSLLSLFLDLQHAPPVFLFGATVAFSLQCGIQFSFQFLGALTPCVTISLDLVTLSLQVGEGFLKSRGELLLGEQVLLDRANPSFLVFLDLGDR